MKSVDDVVAELRIKVAKNLARDVCIVSIDCDDALALSQMAADFSVMLAEGRRAITALQSEAEAERARVDAMREALEGLVAAVVKDSNEHGISGYTGARLSDARAALSQARGEPTLSSEGK